ncbi:hypothetical protein B5P45_00040 [Phyllobacterium zundukense]|uniref:Uncharacterized protein n=1 Tax=Phyllobacterium zundukense TaxID=1867719 RepID=A0A2N9W559_9HYPH|nr:hypothetical protein BLM14_21085 [Phyllobacterium zundukense]PIO46877.1 hypothetical protein B5P45_00040 [Phyllobacterium zundukense]
MRMLLTIMSICLTVTACMSESSCKTFDEIKYAREKLNERFSFAIKNLELYKDIFCYTDKNTTMRNNRSCIIAFVSRNQKSHVEWFEVTFNQDDCAASRPDFIGNDAEKEWFDSWVNEKGIQ